MSVANAKIDYAVKAKSALAAIERFSESIEAFHQQKTMCREKWRDYGEALLAQRVLMPSNQKFGQWVKANGLGQGRAKSHGVRADAMWLAEQYDNVLSKYNGNQHQPTNIRTACREAGYEWAGETSHQKERKKKSVRAGRYSGWAIAVQEGLLANRATGGGTTGKLKKIINERWPEIEIHNKDHEPQLRSAIQQLVIERRPEEAKDAIAEAKELVNESARARFDRALAKVEAVCEGRFQKRLEELQASFETVVAKRVSEALPKEHERLRAATEESLQLTRLLQLRTDRLKQAISKSDYQLILNCLHPDRAPEGRGTKYAKAFNAVKRLHEYVESFDGR